MSKYQIWDKVSRVITPSMEVFTPEEWADRYPISRLDGFDLVIGGGKINGNMCMEYDDFVSMWADQGCEFDESWTKQECLDAIEEFEIAQRAQQQAEIQAQSEVITPEERIAAALEAQVLLSMPDVEE